MEPKNENRGKKRVLKFRVMLLDLVRLKKKYCHKENFFLFILRWWLRFCGSISSGSFRKEENFFIYFIYFFNFWCRGLSGEKVGTQMAPLLKLSFKMKERERGLRGIVHELHGSAPLRPCTYGPLWNSTILSIHFDLNGPKIELY